MRKLTIALMTVLTMTMLFCTSVFAMSEKGEAIEPAPWEVHTLVIDNPYYKPSQVSVMANKEKLPNAPKLLTARELKDLAVQVAGEEKLPYAVVPAPTTGDAYVKLTFSNNSRVALFADVYRTSDNQWLYSYQIVSGDPQKYADNEDNYKMMFHKFYRALKLQLNKNTVAEKVETK